jgi:hypothetical protein
MTMTMTDSAIPDQDPVVLERAAEIPPAVIFRDAKKMLRKGGLRHFAGRSPSLGRAGRRDDAALAKLISRRAEATEALLTLAFDERPPKHVPWRVQTRALWYVLRIAGVRCPIEETDRVLERLAKFMSKPVPDDPDPDDISGMLHPIRIREPKEIPRSS